MPVGPGQNLPGLCQRKGILMRLHNHPGSRRRKALPAVLMLAVSVGILSLAASGAASGDPGNAGSRFQATALTPIPRSRAQSP